MKKQKIARYFGVFMALNILFEVISPTVALALTNGPMQQEFVGFEPAGSSEMVDLFTGDFKYNIPLMDVDGYPLNIAYHAGQNMEAEASWVGLGWSLNPGVLNRYTKGLPDDFNGDIITNRLNYKPNYNVGVGFQIGTLLAGSISANYSGVGIGLGLGGQSTGGALLGYNNYTGHYLELQYEISGQIGAGVGVLFWSPLAGGISGGTGVRINSHDGVTKTAYHAYGLSRINFDKSLSFSNFFTNTTLFKNYNIGQGTTYNSRANQQYKMYFGSEGGSSLLNGITPFGDDVSSGSSHVVPVGNVSFAPRINNTFFGEGFSSSKKWGVYGCSPIPFTPFSVEAGIFAGKNAYVNTSTLVDELKSVPAYGYMNLENADESSLMDFNRYKDGTFMEDAPNTPFSALTNDNFSASAQGMATNFTTKRSDYGIVHDPVTVTPGFNKFSGKETAVGLFYYKVKSNTTNITFGADGNWTSASLYNTLKFYKPDVTTAADRYYEKAYFKVMGEKTPGDPSLPASVTSISPIKSTLASNGPDYDATGPISGSIANPYVKKANRAVKSTNISYLSAKQSSEVGFIKNARNFPLNTFAINANDRMMTGYSNIAKTAVGGSGTDHHLSEITVTKNDGSKYIYGIPVYNMQKKSVAFNASDFIHKTGLPNSAPPEFNDSPLNKHKSLMQVEYGADEATFNNIRGMNKFYNHQITPAYASSFLLTAIVSSDYIDITGDGPTNDDLGNYTLFNYTRTGDYNWRDPYSIPSGHTGQDNGLSSSKNQALLDVGLEADPYDDKGFYEYGTRHNWYLNSIETKNHVAEFEIEERADNRGVIDEDGEIDGAASKSYSLKQIRLFTKEEKIRAQLAAVNPTPIKTVNFEYDYSLCKGVFNNINTTSGYNTGTNTGKLTLKKIYFTYGNSKKSALSPYQFIYGDNDHDGLATQEANPNYDPRANDRWGTYKPNQYLGYPYTNVDNPYPNQDKATQDTYAASWNLTSIITPSGAKTDIYFESDDYSYVQDEACAGMLRVKNLYTDISGSAVGQVTDFSAQPQNNYITKNACLLIDLEGLNTPIPTSIPVNQANGLINNLMFPKKKELYFKAHLRVAHKNAYTNLITDDYDNYVTGYSPYVDGQGHAGIIDKGPGSPAINTFMRGTVQYYKYAYVKLKMHKIRTGNNKIKEVSPITYAGYDLVRTHLPRLAFPGSEPSASNFYTLGPLKKSVQLIRALSIAWRDHRKTMRDQPYKKLYKRGYCDEVHFDKFWVRAYAPLKNKLGGGHRVKKIITNDNWSSMVSGENSSTYGQTYDYTTKETTQNPHMPAGTMISSGVANYEPLLGGDENPMRKPINYLVENNLQGIKKAVTLSPNDHYFQEEPYCEYLYPSPMVGYSKVTIKNIDHVYGTYPNQQFVCQVGRTVYEFYTAKDFPIIEKRTVKDLQKFKTDPIDNHIITPFVENKVYTSQGFSVVFNDMHGKIKKLSVYGENALLQPLSEVSYVYNTQPHTNGSMKVDDQIPMIDENLVVSNQVVGRNTDVTTDMRRSKNTNVSIGWSTMRKVSLCNPLGRRGINVNFGIMELALHATNTTKITQQFGILKSVITKKDGGTVTTENLLWDKNTGESVLTKTTKHFDNTLNSEQPVYSFNYPAYWIYKNMGQEYNRDKIIFKASTDITSGNWVASTGALNKSDVAGILKEGDQVAVYDQANALLKERLWIVNENTSNPLKYYLLDENGLVFNTGYNSSFVSNDDFLIKIIKPIEKNTTIAVAGQVATLVNPLSGSTFTNPDQKIINSNAVEYCEIWDFYKNSYNQQSGMLYPSNHDPSQPPPVGAPTPTINPYIAAQLGQWRPLKSYKYNSERKYSTVQYNVKEDGVFNDYVPFWSLNTSNTWDPIYATVLPPGVSNNWVVHMNNKIYSPHGYLMESVDAIGNKHCIRLGFNHSLPVLNAGKASVFEVGFDGFEEYKNLYNSFNAAQLATNDYMKVADYIAGITSGGNPATKAALTTNTSHTGRYCIDFTQGKTLKFNAEMDQSPESFFEPIPRCNQQTIFKLNSLKIPAGQKQIISFWIKGKVNAQDYTSQFNLSAQATAGANVLAATVSAPVVTSVINGWQKFDYEVIFSPPFNPSGGPINCEFIFSVPGGGSGFYLDDFRTQPFNASLNTLVYDPYHLRVWAQLDDRNFATIMEYDNEGVLVRTKKESEKGIYTINEVRKSIKK